MATETKTLRLSITADSLNATKALNEVNSAIKGTEATLKSFSTTMRVDGNGAVVGYTHDVEVMSAKVREFKKIQGELSSIPKALTIPGGATSNVLGERLSTAKAVTSESLTAMRQSIKEQIAVAKEGSDSVLAVKTKAAGQQIALEDRLQAKLKEIQTKFSEGTLNRGLQSSIDRVVESYGRATVQLARSTDERIAQLKREADAEALTAERIKRIRELRGQIRTTYAGSTSSELLAQTKAAMEAELAITKYGLRSKEVARAFSNEQERKLVKKLHEDIATLEKQYSKGTITKPVFDDRVKATLAAYKAELLTLPGILENVTSAHKSLARVTGELLLAWTALHRIKTMAADVVGSFAKVGIELDSTKASLQATMGTSAGMEAALVALEHEAERTGIQIGTLRENFRGFQASTSLAGATSEQTWSMFTKLNTVITGLHMSADKAQGVFNAMAQIFNKSKVQSEELVKQLGNLLPGAFAAFAKSIKNIDGTIGISQEELAKRMKAGTVYAQDTMEDFISFYSTRFAPAFMAAQNGLNANWGRFQTSITQLKEAVYESSSSILNDITKMGTGFVKTITEMVRGGNELSASAKALSSVLNDVLLASAFLVTAGFAKARLEMLAYAAACTSTTTAAVALNSTLALLGKLKFVVVVAGIVEITERLLEAAQAGKKARESIAEMAVAESEFREQTTKALSEAGRIEIEVESDAAVKEYKKFVDTTKASLASLNSAKAGRGQTITSEQDRNAAIKAGLELEKYQAGLDAARLNARKVVLDKMAAIDQEAHEARMAKAKSQIAENVAAGARAYRTMQEEIDTKNHELADKQDKAKHDREQARIALETARNSKESADKVQKAQIYYEEMGRVVLSNEEAQGKFIAEIKEKWAKKSESAANKVQAAKVKGIKEDIQVDNQFIKTAETIKQVALENLQAANDAEVKSIEEFFGTKQAILDKAYQDEKKFYEDRQALAAKTGNKAIVAEAGQSLERLQEAYKGETKTRESDQTTATNELKTNLVDIRQKYQDIVGIERDSDEIGKSKLALTRRLLEAEVTRGGALAVESAEGLKQLDTYLKIDAVQRQMNFHQKEMDRSTKVYNSAIERTRTLKDAGVIGELQAAVQNTEAKKKQLAAMEKLIKADEDSLATQKLTGQERDLLVERINNAREAMENFKVTSDEVATLFEGKLSSAFESSFTGVITGSMSATDAFKSFGKSVLQTIAEMIAAEARSAILKPLFSMAFSAISGGFGSIGDSLAGASSGTFGVLKSNMNANGGVYSGQGISSYSGTIVDKPTIFPFAKGTGLMGEAGAEAILPLKRNSQGKLGVSLENGGQAANSPVYYINTTVNTSSNASADEIGGKVAQQVMRAIAKQEINSASRRGNQLNPITKYG